METFDIIDKGGIVMIALMGLSVYVLGVVFYKLYQFYSAGLFQTAFIEQAMRPIKTGEWNESLRILAPVKHPVARVMRVAMECLRNRDMSARSREAEISRIGSQELRYLESHLRGLELVASIGPLMGLLGTVTGMVSSFNRLADAGSRVDPSMLAGGIWEALLTTAGGLLVAIPALASYYLLDGVIERVRSHMKDSTIQIMALEDLYRRGVPEPQRAAVAARPTPEKVAPQKAVAEKVAVESVPEPTPVQAEMDQQMMLQELQRRELETREEALRRMLEEQERVIASMRATASAPQGTSTLRLLNPTYTRF